MVPLFSFVPVTRPVLHFACSEWPAFAVQAPYEYEVRAEISKLPATRASFERATAE